VRRKDGSVFFADITANPIVLSGQACLVGSFRDITPRKQMEAELRRLNEKLAEAVQAQTDELRVSVDRLQDEVVRRVLAEGKLRKSSRLLEAFFQHTIAPLAFLDRQFHFVRVNEAYARAQGRTPEFFVHQNYFSLYPSEEDRTLFEHVVQTKQPYQAYARLFPFSHSPQRALTYWNWRLTPLLNDAGEVQFIVFNLEDVTERQKAFGELEQRAHQLQKLTLELAQAEDRERRRLAEILHDDLQQVLAAAKFHLGLLHHRVRGDAEAKELADHLTGMLREAIEKSRSLSHELSPAVLYQSDLGETFEWLARQVQAKHGLTVHLEVHGRIDSPSEPIKAFLFRAAQEILFNAAKHAQVKEARLRLQRRRGQLWLTVADRGRGFDPHTLSQTSGFGLFSIRERVELLGGRMKIRSAKSRGAVFLIAVDDGAGEHTEQRAQDKERLREAVVAPLAVVPRPSDDPRLRILLVDDHKIMRDGLAALIGEQVDLQVVGQAGDGHQAVEMARGLGPDVVVMDVAMPTMPGDEAARQIKAILPQTRIVALSMFEEPGVAQRMRDAGAEIYLPKTAPSDGLLAAIRGRE
jgi:PAS domain S-box-containing protein